MPASINTGLMLALAALSTSSPMPSSNPANSTHSLEARAVPPACSFESSRGDFTYVDYSDSVDGDACWGFTSAYNKCNQPWAGQELQDIQTAMALVLQKDGQFSAGKAGAWTATFFVGTTAFDVREDHIFQHATIDENNYNRAGAGAQTYYWDRNGNKASVVRDGCP